MDGIPVQASGQPFGLPDPDDEPFLAVALAVDGVLTTILSREATLRRVQLTMDELIRENRRLELNLNGLKS